MKLTHYYPDEADNFYTVIGFEEDEEDGRYLILSNPRLEGGVAKLHVDCCLGFTPQIGDYVEQFVNDDGDEPQGWILKKAEVLLG